MFQQHSSSKSCYTTARFSQLIIFVCIVTQLSVLVPQLGYAAPSAQSAATWSQYRHDAQRSGRADTGLPVSANAALHLQWAYSFGERVEVEVEPIVADGKIFVGAMNGIMTAINGSDGSLAWRFQTGPIPHTAAYADNRLFFGSLDGHIYALDATTGKQLWRVDTGRPVYAAPAVANNTVYIGSTSGRFYALDVSNGGQRWVFPTDGSTAWAFTGAAALSPDGQRVYVGNEDMHARAFQADNGSLLWDKKLLGVGMRAVHPVVADNGNVVIFQTTKAGMQSYLPTEDYPKTSLDANPASTWNSYYQRFPERRASFFLNAGTGNELWDTATERFVPLPLPYWGMLAPVLDKSGNAWMPVPGGGEGQNIGAEALNHDMRLVSVALDSGVATQVAVRDAFQMRPDENGRATMAGDAYVTTISEDMGAYRTGSNQKQKLFVSPVDHFDSHMDPLAPLPSKHIWRYGGVVAMGGVPAASPAVIVGDRVYYISFGWLFALGTSDKGKDPSPNTPLKFTAQDDRANVLTYPRSDIPTISNLQAELDQRVTDMIAAGVQPPYARFEQAGFQMTDEISRFQLFGTIGEKMWVLSQALRFVSTEHKGQALVYMRQLAEQELFNPDSYKYEIKCLIYGQDGVKQGDACRANSQIITSWQATNDLLIGENLYAMAAYSEATGDWSLVEQRWSLIKSLFKGYSDSWDSTLGFAKFPKWRVGKLGLSSQIGAAAGMLRMARHQGDTTTTQQAQAMLDNLLGTRVRLQHYVQDRYADGTETVKIINIDPDGVPNRKDIFVYNDGGELIPIEGERNSTSDVRQLNWYDGTTASYHSATGFMHYAALVGYSPLYPELAEHIKRELLPETQRYVQTYEINAPWWWMADLSHHTTTGGEHLWHSASLSHDMFQTKALVLNEDWTSLARQLPEPMSSNPRYDLYRLHNLATLLALGEPDLKKSTFNVIPVSPRQGVNSTIVFSLRNTGGPTSEPIEVVLSVPSELKIISTSPKASQGSINLSGAMVSWYGTLATTNEVTIELRVVPQIREVRTVYIKADVNAGQYGQLSFSQSIILNGYTVALPLVSRNSRN